MISSIQADSGILNLVLLVGLVLLILPLRDFLNEHLSDQLSKDKGNVSVSLGRDHLGAYEAIIFAKLVQPVLVLPML